MKRTRLLWTFCICAAIAVLSGCDPLGPVSQKVPDTTISTPVVTLSRYGATAATIEWQAVLGATSYQVEVYAGSTATGTPVKTITRTVQNLIDAGSYSNGYFTYAVKELEGLTKYALAVVAKSSSATSVASAAVTFTTKDPYEVPPEIAPNAFISSFTDTTATVEVTPVSGITTYVLYCAPIPTAGGVDTSSSYKVLTNITANTSYTFTNLNAGTNYFINVFVAIGGETDALVPVTCTRLELIRDTSGIATTLTGVPTVVVSAFTTSTVSLEVTTNGSSIGGAYHCVLLRKDSPNGAYQAVGSKAMAASTSSTVTLVDNLGLSSGKTYYYSACNILDTGTERSVLAPLVQAQTAIAFACTATPNSLTFSWEDGYVDASYDMKLSSASLSSDDLVVEGTRKSITIGGNENPLVADTDYTFDMTVTMPDGIQYLGSFACKTASWAGTYRWDNPDVTSGKRSNFAVKVSKNADYGPSKSVYPYYAFVAASDSDYVSNYRIMPLIDPYSDTTAPTGYIPYSSDTQSYEKAYRWNEQKWNTTSMTPSKWKVGTAPTADAMLQNSYVVVMNTIAMGMTLETTTSFTYKMIDGQQYLLFSNKGTGTKAGFVNLGLYKNPSPNTALGEDSYTYALKLVQEGV